MKQLRLFAAPLLLALIATALNPAAVFAQNGSVIASAVIVPAQISRLGFPITAPIKEVMVKEGDVVTAGQTLITLNSPDLEYAVIAADAAHRSAEAYAELQRYKKVRDFRNGKEFWDSAPPEVRQRADAQALSAYSRLEIAQATLAQSILVAPFGGTVVSLNTYAGEVAQQGQSVIALATLDNLIIETTDLSERDILKVRVGAPVSITVESLNKTFSGKVISIAPKADIVGGDVVFKVTIAFDEQPQGALWGMTAEVTIGE